MHTHTCTHTQPSVLPCPAPIPADLAAQIQENVEAVLRMPPAAGSGAAGTRGKSGGGEPRELAELRSQISKDQQLLIQFAEEKVQLAVQVGGAKGVWVWCVGLESRGGSLLVTRASSC